MATKESKPWYEEEHSLAETLAEAEKGNREAMFTVVLQIGQTGYADDDDTINLLVKYLTILADEGDSVCMIMLAGHYEQGDGVPKDINKAIELYEKAAKNGYAFGFECIGLMYFRGRDVPKDYGKAWQYIRKAGKENGYYGSSACTWYAVGEMYRNGWEVKQDLPKAEEYYDKVVNANCGEMDAYYYPALFQKARLVLVKERKEGEIDKAINNAERLYKEYLKSAPDATLRECITEKELTDIINELKQAKEDEPRSITLELYKPMTMAEFDRQIVRVIPTLRCMRYEFIVVALHYDHPYKIRFIQTLLDDEDGSYCVEAARYETPSHRYKRYEGKMTFKLYRLEPVSEVGLRDVIEIFRKALFGKDIFDLGQWRDITKKLIGVNYYSTTEK